MANNLAPARLNRAKLTALPCGTAVIDANMSIYIKRDNSLWEGEDGRRIQLDSLYATAHTPLRRWKGPVR